MAKIIQSLKTITADFTKIENQYQNNTFDIEVELSDETFKDYIVMLSISNPQHKTETYPIPIISGVAKLPYYCTDYLGTTTISLFGYKSREDSVITTNAIDFEVVASNPTNMYIAPDTNWNITMKNYVNSQIDILGQEIEPTISEENHHWLIGGVDTGVRADGMTGDYYTKAEVDEKLGDATSVKEITLSTTWIDGLQTVNVDGITENDSPILDVKLNGDFDTTLEQQAEWNKIVQAITGDGTITFLSSEDTAIDLTVLVKGR